MSPTHTPLWNSPAFTIERVEDKVPRTLIFHFTGPFIANDMYRSLKPAVVSGIFEFKPEPGQEQPVIHIFDLTQVPSMDSSGLGLIVSHYMNCRSRGIRVIAVGVNPNVQQLLHFTRVDSLIPTAATVEEAIAS